MPHTWPLIQRLVAAVVAVPRSHEKGGVLSHAQSYAVSEVREGGRGSIGVPTQEITSSSSWLL